jgi:hypothetical protein
MTAKTHPTIVDQAKLALVDLESARKQFMSGKMGVANANALSRLFAETSRMINSQIAAEKWVGRLTAAPAKSPKGRVNKGVK